ncbi:MAG: NAD(P)H-binding protein, partial [Chloroflexi bacterium]|nr:NAD(P)H-binding protein [Chloroflexota bacterium]
MKVVVTGASGLTGRLVAMRLVENGHDVVGVARHPATVPGVRIVAGDCGGPMTMAPLLDRADALVHVAGILHGARVAALPGTARLPHLVAVSSAGVHSRHRRSATAYLAGEMALRAAHPEPVIIRPTMIYGS